MRDLGLFQETLSEISVPLVWYGGVEDFCSHLFINLTGACKESGLYYSNIYETIKQIIVLKLIFVLTRY